MRFHLASRIATIVALAAIPVLAETTNVSPNAFTSSHRAEVNASPAAVYAALGQLGRWWDPRHTYSGKSENLSLDLRAGGCWCEQWDGGSVEHARVIYAAPGKALRVEGGFGPLQAMAVSAVVTYAIKTEGEKTILTMTYNVRGADAGLDKLAPLVDKVMAEGFARLVEFAGKGG